MNAAATVATYLQAWNEQDPQLIVTIFTADATYHERVLQEPIRTGAGIRAYWETKVVREQGNIDARLLSLYRADDGVTAIAEWEATFDDLVGGCRKRMREVAILEFRGELIASPHGGERVCPRARRTPRDVRLLGAPSVADGQDGLAVRRHE